MFYAWFDLYPHSIWVTAFLYKGKIFDYNIGQLPKDSFSRTVILNSDEDKDRAFNCTTETKEFIVNNGDEHNNVFSVLAFDWLDQFEKEEGFKLNLDIISKRNVPKILEILEAEKYQQSLINGIPNCYYYVAVSNLIEWIKANKDENFLSNNSFNQYKDKYKNKLNSPNIDANEASIIGQQIAYLSKLFDKLKNEIN